MNNYLDLLATKNIVLPIQIVLEPIVDNGVPTVDLSVNDHTYYNGALSEKLLIETKMLLLDTVRIEISMTDKIYCPDRETAAVIKSITIDGYELTEHSCESASCIFYQNDQNVDYRGFYLGFNGVWRFELDRPFYQWWHVVSGQGWLLEPASTR
jgi:hypothetical protein